MSEKKLRLKEVVVVEGRYDRIKLSELIATPVIETGGFRVFKDRQKQRLLVETAKKRGLLIMTDSDAAGFVIRNFLKEIVPPDTIKNGYIPSIPGKEKRKEQPSREGLLGVEGISLDALREAVSRSGATVLSEETSKHDDRITLMDLYDAGLWGGKRSKRLREQLLDSLGLPRYLSAKATAEALGCLFTKEEFEAYVSRAFDDGIPI